MPDISLPTVLAVETSTVACSVALIHHGKVYNRHEILPQKHAHRLLEMVDEVMAESELTSADISLLAFGEGPGAFTGIRIASGVIQGLAIGWDKPVVAVSSLRAMALATLTDQACLHQQAWCALLDARMNEVYCLTGNYTTDGLCVTDGEPRLLSPELALAVVSEIKGCCGVGDIKNEYSPITLACSQWHDGLPNAVEIAKLAQLSAGSAKTLEQAIPSPLYLRNHVADTIAERKLKQQSKAD